VLMRPAAIARSRSAVECSPIFDNAIKHTLPRAKVQFRVAGTGRQRIITDSGPGIHWGAQNVFRRFYRVESVAQSNRDTDSV
jgi:K+-sensing histidine kinase KdpD